MAELPPPIQPVFDNEQSPTNVSPISSRDGQTSPIQDFSPSAYFHNNGYHQQMQYGHHDMSTMQQHHQEHASTQAHSTSSPPPSVPPIRHVTPTIGAGGLGIAMQPGPSRSPVVRKPVGSTSPTTPGATRSMYGFMDDRSTLSSPVMERSLPSQSSPDYGDRIIEASPDMGRSYGSATPLNAAVITTPASPSSSPGNTPKVMEKQVNFADDEEFDDEVFYKGFASPPSYCNSKEDIHTKRTSWLSLTVFLLSVYSTVMSGIWLITSFVQPRWGHKISSNGGMHPSTATTVAALLAKTIEMSFVTVFVSLLGQVLTRRSFIRKTHGMTLAEMTMRNWVIQPGSLITHGESVPSAAMTVLGALTLTATIAATFYTTASDAMVAPKLKFGSWEHRELEGNIRASYANAAFVKQTCAALNLEADPENAPLSCMDVQSAGHSYRNLLNLMAAWDAMNKNGSFAGWGRPRAGGGGGAATEGTRGDCCLSPNCRASN